MLLVHNDPCGALEHAQEMAAHESPRTTKLYDRTKERLTQEEVERIRMSGLSAEPFAVVVQVHVERIWLRQRGGVECGRSVDVGLHEELSFGR